MKLTLSTLSALFLLLGSELPGCFFVRASSVVLQTTSQQQQQEPEDERGIIALDQSLRELTNPHTVLCIAARPGDEDDGTLAYVHKKLGARAVMLFATRG